MTPCFPWVLLQRARDLVLEQINIENVHLLCKDLSSNPCSEIGVGGLCPPLSDNLKAKLL